MPTPSDAFRDFGILPEGMKTSPQLVRCFFSGRRVVGQYLATVLAAGLGLGLALLFVLILPFPLNGLAGVAHLVGFTAIIYSVTRNDYAWIELDGHTLRAKHLYTRRLVERSVEEVERLVTIVYQVRTAATAITETWLGRVRGIEIRFRDQRTPMQVRRADPAMTNAKELIEALIFRMAELGEVDAEITGFLGKPLVRQIYWKGDTRKILLRRSPILSLCIVGLGLMFGSVLAPWGRQEYTRRALGSAPPQGISLKTLIENGPGNNRHLTLTDFEFGGYVVESRGANWTRVWIALFPIDHGGRNDIKAVLGSSAIHDVATLNRFLQKRQVDGICSGDPSGFGLSLGPKLTEANAGAQLSSAWTIDDLSETPSAERVRNIFLGVAACFAVAIAFALVVFTKKPRVEKEYLVLGG